MYSFLVNIAAYVAKSIKKQRNSSYLWVFLKSPTGLTKIQNELMEVIYIDSALFCNKHLMLK